MIGAWLRRRKDAPDWTQTDASFLISVCNENAYAEARSRAEEASEPRTARHWSKVAQEIARREQDPAGKEALRLPPVSDPNSFLPGRPASQALGALRSLEEALERRARGTQFG